MRDPARKIRKEGADAFTSTVRFALGEFHDQFLAAGMIPVALAEWEMAGIKSDKEIDLH